MTQASSTALRQGRVSRVLTFTLGGVLLAAALFVAGWAARELTMPVERESPTLATYVTITEGEIGQALTLGATTTWKRTPLPPSQVSGVLTSLIPDGDVAEEGTVLYTVDLRPVVLGIGDVPMFRDIAQGSEGQDVRQLQELLTRSGFFAGEADGVARSDTDSSIRLWQRHLGIPADGTVRRGDVLFAAAAPITVVSSNERSVGDSVSIGERLVSQIADHPEVVLTLTEGQRALLTEGMRVTATRTDGHVWEGQLGAMSSDPETSATRTLIIRDDGAPFCADACGGLQLDETILVTVHQTEPLSGLTVPITAIQTDSSGATSATLSTGESIHIDVRGTADGMAVIEGAGLQPGDQLIVGHADG